MKTKQQNRPGATGRLSTAGRIIDAAERVFLDLGYAAFGSRRVAAQASMSLATLQYHFPTTTDLLEATVRSLVNRFAHETDVAVEGTDNVEEKLRNTIGYILSQVIKPDVCRLFFELWSLAQRDDVTRDVIRQTYQNYRENFRVLAAQMDPAAQSIVHVARATLLAATLEGIIVFTFKGGPGVGDWPTLQQMIKDNAVNLFLGV
ncbi:MAG: TetR/AcrR family transcriptional regulator [Janthinobacterium lividum]